MNENIKFRVALSFTDDRIPEFDALAEADQLRWRVVFPTSDDAVTPALPLVAMQSFRRHADAAGAARVHVGLGGEVVAFGLPGVSYARHRAG